MLRFLFFIVMVVVAVPAHADITGVPSIIDGDTIDIRGVRFRLHGIDAPESSQLCEQHGQPYRCGQQAALALDGLIKRQPVRCEEKDKDRYGRIVAICFLGNLDINRWMVEQGHAVAYRKYSSDYTDSEDAARAAHRGVWAGEFQMPWDWRMAKRSGNAAPAVAAPEGCTIKGNISNSGRIYHLPGGTWYEKTKIDIAKGERWFCLEEVARSAGWQKSNQ